MENTPKFKIGDTIKNSINHQIYQVTKVEYREDRRSPFPMVKQYLLGQQDIPVGKDGEWWRCDEIDIGFVLVPEKPEDEKLETEETEEMKKQESNSHNGGRRKSRRNTKRRRKTRGNKRRKTRGNKRRKTRDN